MSCKTPRPLLEVLHCHLIVNFSTHSLTQEARDHGHAAQNLAEAGGSPNYKAS